MLIEFRVKNFRSLRDEQTLSLVAAKDSVLKEENTFETGIKAVPALLKGCAIYGANAGGKSNLIKALQYMRGVVLESATTIQPEQTYSVQPFRLSDAHKLQPTEFEVTFLKGGVRYQYGFVMTSARIISEYLLVYKTAKPSSWFERNYNPETGEDEYTMGTSLKGKKSVWREATRPNALFLSMAVQLNSEALMPVYDWFVNDLTLLNEQSKLSPEFTIGLLRHQQSKDIVCKMLRAADISISDIEVKTRKVPSQSIHFNMEEGTTEVTDQESMEDRIIFHHTTEQGEALFELQDESAGTQSFLFLIGLVLQVLKSGKTVVVDELDTSLHPLLVRELVSLFGNPEINPLGAQLIFTTHDTSLLSAPFLLRRDQVWFVEKDADQASTLIPLTDFSPRNSEALERGYLQGRYGGIPFIDGALGLSDGA